MGCPAGAAILRDPRTWHGGTPNVSSIARAIPNALFTPVYSTTVVGPQTKGQLIPQVGAAYAELFCALALCFLLCHRCSQTRGVLMNARRCQQRCTRSSPLTAKKSLGTFSFARRKRLALRACIRRSPLVALPGAEAQAMTHASTSYDDGHQWSMCRATVRSLNGFLVQLAGGTTMASAKSCHERLRCPHALGKRSRQTVLPCRCSAAATAGTRSRS